MEPQAIAAIVEKIIRSPLSVGEYFQRHRVPFSRARYFHYKTRLAERGLGGLIDGRRHGNRRTLTEDARSFIYGAHTGNPRLSLGEIAERLGNALGLRVTRMTVSRCLRAQGLKVERPNLQEAKIIDSACGGFEILAALALHLGWAAHTARVIVEEREQFRKSAAFREERVWRDREGRNARGHFTARYNRRADIREQRFASVEDKRRRKNYSRMELFKNEPHILQRKCLGVLALPLITVNGMIRSANNPLGNALEHFCGFNYQHNTLDKFLRELKYFGISDRLLRDQISFWRAHWQKHKTVELPFLCYYVDGNTKALWSSKRVKQNKVTMLGRIMGCLEQVFVHDAFGHPVYLETYAGKAPVGEHVLSMFEKIEAALEGPGPALKVERVIVMDSASNGVCTLRAFAAQDKYHYITSLDDNQWNPRKLIKQGRAQRYEYGRATLYDCRLELKDSKEKGFLVEVRAIRIEWDYEKCTVLITSLPKETVRASLVVKAYFDRWPCEELQFRRMKSFASLNRVAGYGKKKLVDEKRREAQKELAGEIAALQQELKEPLEQIAVQEERLARLIKQECRMRAQGKLVEGRRVLKASARSAFTQVSRKIAAVGRQLKTLKAPLRKELKRLNDCEDQWLGHKGKGHVYHIDVELDQLMGFFRMALVNIASFFLNECLGGSSMSLARLLHAILMTPAQIKLTDQTRSVVLKRNPKDPQMTSLIETGLRRLTELNIRDLDGRAIQFSLGLD